MPSAPQPDEVVEVFTGDTLEEAMAYAVATLGPDLTVRRARRVRKGVQGLRGKDRYEVVAVPAVTTSTDAVGNAFASLLHDAEEREEATTPVRRTTRPASPTTSPTVLEVVPDPEPVAVHHPAPAATPPVPVRATAVPVRAAAVPAPRTAAAARSGAAAPRRAPISAPRAAAPARSAAPRSGAAAPRRATISAPRAAAPTRSAAPRSGDAAPRAAATARFAAAPTRRAAVPAPRAAAPARTARVIPTPADALGWSRAALRHAGVPPVVLRALPERDPRSDAAWVSALAKAFAAVVPPPGDDDVVVSGRGVAGVRGIVAGARRGVAPGTITYAGRTAPATATELALAVRHEVLS